MSIGEQAECLASIMHRRHEELSVLAVKCFKFLFFDEKDEIFNILSSHLEGHQDRQMNILMDCLELEEIPADRPDGLDHVLWEFMTIDLETESHTFLMARLIALVGLLGLHQSGVFLYTGDVANSILAYGQANLMFGRAFATGAAYFGRDSVGAQARRAVGEKLKRDPKQIGKAAVRECWELWQASPDRYSGKAAFARDMLQKFESLSSQPVIERWCREWSKDTEPEE